MSEDELLRNNRATFNGFVKGSVWSTVIIIITLVLLAAFLL